MAQVPTLDVREAAIVVMLVMTSSVLRGRDVKLSILDRN